MEKLKRSPQWIFALDILKEQSPSRKDGVSFDNELRQQAKAVKFIVSVSDLLKLPAVTIYTAATYLHRFYRQFSLNKLHPYESAGACLFLAAKTEETARRIKEVAIACTKVASKNLKMAVDENSRDLARWADSIMYNEELVLEALYFDFELPSPYEALSKLVSEVEIEESELLKRTATDFVNDSCRTLLSMMYESTTIAAAGLYWASNKLNTNIPTTGGEEWYRVSGLERRTLESAINDMAFMMDVVRNGQLDGQIYEKVSAL